MMGLLNGWLLPACYMTGFALACLLPRQHWTVARITAGLGLASTLVTTTAAGLAAGLADRQVDKPGLTVALLIALLGWVIIRYAARYLEGEAQQPRFVKALLFTLACVSLLVVSQHLVLLVLGWSCTSLGLHYLLTFYRERRTAQVVAHKKFIVSRLADLSLLAALVLIYQAAGTLSLRGLSDYLAHQDALPTGLHWAAGLFALAAILKSAQLPLHGWLIQVMEAPTPVSALLHAGVVNVGGFVLIRLAELLALAPASQILLVLVGSLTAVLASLVMMTRISIKVRLAWSTCAQMGFMLVEVGLGLYELALLHLVAHSFYKAHAFLAAGETVSETRALALLGTPGARRSLLRYLLSPVVSGMLVAGSLAGWQWLLPAAGLTLPTAATLVLALGLAPLLWLEQGRSVALLAHAGLRVLLLIQVYFVWHWLFAGLAPAASGTAPWLMAWVCVAFVLLYGLQIWLRRHPQGRLAQRLYPWAYCGFYLDETFTRLTFALWPARLGKLQPTMRPDTTPLGETV
ncbi:NADH-quinone oxidoreductase subunit L [Pseudaeromonas sp. ZJS20]|uniref:NADH-quinone oxidoreductase subunit L n=1 Tax=Pseudaeromonas aegiceratis TaxID=3153928 RepID=UPI00390C9CC6